MSVSVIFSGDMCPGGGNVLTFGASRAAARTAERCNTATCVCRCDANYEANY